VIDFKIKVRILDLWKTQDFVLRIHPDPTKIVTWGVPSTSLVITVILKRFNRRHESAGTLFW